MGFGRDTDRPGSWKNLVAENVFGFGIEFISMLVNDFQIAGILLGSAQLSNEGTNGRFNEVREVFKGMGKLVNANQQIFGKVIEVLTFIPRIYYF